MASVLPSGTPVVAAPCGRDAAVRARTWFVSTPPHPPRGAAREAAWGAFRYVKAAGIDPADPRVLFVTNGTAVQRSDDGGCTWREVWRLGPLPSPSMPDDTVARITSLDVAHVKGRSRVLLTVLQATDHFGHAARVLVVRSDDGRTGWAVAYETVGTFDASASLQTPSVRSGAGGVAYALLPSPLGHLVYARSADGTTWETRTSATDTDAPVTVKGFVVSPWNPDEVWEWGGRSERSTVQYTDLRRSTDGARTWQVLNPYPDPKRKNLAAVDIAWPRRGGPARVIAVATAYDEFVDARTPLVWSGDGGASFASLASSIPVPLTSLLAHNARGDVVLSVRGGSTFLIPHGNRPPRPGSWRRMPSLPVKLTGERYYISDDPGRTTATSPSVLLVPSFEHLQLLTFP